MVSPRLGRHEGAIRWGCSRGQSRQAFDHPSPGVPVPSSQISSTLRALLCFSRLVSFNQVKQSLYIYLILEIIGEDRSKSRWQSKIYLNCFTGGCQYLQSFVIFGNTIAGSTSHGCRVFSFDLDSSSWSCEWDHITDGSRERVWLYQASITRERQSWDEDTGCFPPAGVIQVACIHLRALNIGRFGLVVQVVMSSGRWPTSTLSTLIFRLVSESSVKIIIILCKV